MMKWRLWPQPAAKRFQVKLKIHSLEGLHCLLVGKSGDPENSSSCANVSCELGKVVVSVDWKGCKNSFSSQFGRLKQVRTMEKTLEDNALVIWDEEFEHLCILSMSKDGQCVPLEVRFVISQVGLKSKVVILGNTVMNLVEFISKADCGEKSIKLQVLTPNGEESRATLMVTLSFIDLGTRENSGFDCFGPLLCKMDEPQCVVEPTEKRTLEASTFVNGKLSSGEMSTTPKSEDTSDNSRESFGSDLVCDWHEEVLACGDEHHMQCYRHLAGVNLHVDGALPYCREKELSRDLMLPISNCATLDALLKEVEQVECNTSRSSIRSILAWRKRKLGFRSPKEKGEPLLKKDYGEDGGDDIDFDRRISCSPNECQVKENGVYSSDASGCLDFGEEDFAVGNWERKELLSRDGLSKITVDVFFATIDQGSERAAGESACTALVAVIADWLHQNPARMPIKAEFDTLIREGSTEWRKLCDIEAYKDCFPDRHFDLDSVLQAKVRPVCTIADSSFVGFFVSEGIGDMLQGSMSFDDIWEEVVAKSVNENSSPAIYIVSWNDHFFVLKIDRDECYIIDTLGARLYEGCSQAYILRFDEETDFCYVSNLETAVKEGATSLRCEAGPTSVVVDPCLVTRIDNNCDVKEGENVNLFKGKSACKEFIKGFFAALILRELEADLRKGLLQNIPLHHRLQIEFHFTKSTLSAM